MKFDSSLFAEHLEKSGATQLGQSIDVLDSVSSTNDYAKELAKEGAAHGTVIVAEQQEAGRGQHGKAWFSGQGDSLLYSVILKPEFSSKHWSRVTPAAGVSLAGAIEELYGADGLVPQLKWVNDLYLKEKKVAGILAEMTVTEEPSLILGVGVNVSQESGDFPVELAGLASSLREAGVPQPSREEVLAVFFTHLEKNLECSRADFAEVVADWNARALWKGQEIVCEAPGRESQYQGVLLGMGSEGELLLESSAQRYRLQSARDLRLAT